MPARTITETRLAPGLSISLVRSGTPPTLTWALLVSATVLDQNGDPVRQVGAEDVMGDLTSAQQTQLRTLANALATRLAARLEVADQ